MSLFVPFAINTVLNVCIILIMFQLIHIIFQSNVSRFLFERRLKQTINYQNSWDLILFVGCSLSRCFRICKGDTTVYFNETLEIFQLFWGPSPAPCLWQQNSHFMQNHDVFLNLTKWNLFLNLIGALAQCRGKTEMESPT